MSAVHSKGCYIYCQLWAQGWAASPETLAKHGLKMMTADGTKMPGTEIPEEMVHTMTEEDIQETILAYVTAAQNAIMAGFDGIEIHGGNGYLPDQFLQTSSNSKRTDKWGGSIENRTRFTVEIVNAIAGAIGADRSALRLSPWSDFNFMGQMTDEEVFKTFVHLIQTLRPLGLSWLDLIEPRIRGNDDAPCGVGQSIEFLVRAWDGASPIILSGGHTLESARAAIDKYSKYDVAVMFGRFFVSNPDLVFRFREGIPLTKYNRTYFYTPKLAKGYTDWLFSEEFLEATASKAAQG